MNAWIRLSRRVEQLISPWNSNQLRIISILMLLSFLSWDSIDSSLSITSSPCHQPYPNKELFLSCFHASKLSKFLHTQKLAPGSTASMLTSMIQIHHILVLESIPCRIPRWPEKCYPTHPCLPIIHSHARLKGDAVGKFRIEVLNTFANPILSLLTSIFQLFCCYVCGSWLFFWFYYCLYCHMSGEQVTCKSQMPWTQGSEATKL